MIHLEIEYPPVAWKAHGGFGANSYNPRQEERDLYQFEIKKQFHHNNPLTIGVKINCYFYMPIPVSYSKKEREKILQRRVMHLKRPDLDNLCKFFLDCIKTLVIKDDSQVVELHAYKLYGETPKTVADIAPY